VDIPVKMKPSQCVLCHTTEHDGRPCSQSMYGHHKWDSWNGTVDKDALIADLKVALADLEGQLVATLTRAEMAEMWRRRWKTRATIFAECNRIAREAYKKLLAADDKTVDEAIETEMKLSEIAPEAVATMLQERGHCGRCFGLGWTKRPNGVQWICEACQGDGRARQGLVEMQDVLNGYEKGTEKS
jgi:hypothetical protein